MKHTWSPQTEKAEEKKQAMVLLSWTISISYSHFILRQPYIVNGQFLAQNFAELKNLISASCVCLHLMNTMSQFNFLFIFIWWQYLCTHRTKLYRKGSIQLHRRMNHNSGTSHAPTGRPEHTHWNEDPGIVNVTGKNPAKPYSHLPSSKSRLSWRRAQTVTHFSLGT